MDTFGVGTLVPLKEENNSWTKVQTPKESK